MAENEVPKIGKNVIETLTTGMYDDARFIYREYIQNAADQIDVAVDLGILKNRSEGKIKIEVNSKERLIIVEDNATGIRNVQIRKFLGDVANSEKEPNKQKGFRGIGRLGGLGYCEKLIFETSYLGEDIKNTMTFNAQLLKSIIENRNDHSDAASVISIVTSITSEKEKKGEHYFKVRLEGVPIDQIILKKDLVREYLEMVAPVSFNPTFSYAKKIKAYFKKNDFLFDEYDTILNGVPVYKAYKNDIVKNEQKLPVTDIGFLQVRSANQAILALGWYGIYVNVNEVIDKANNERGIRIRLGNIAIGDEKTLFKVFKADRTNLRYIGEIHVKGNGFIPNARRDYFNDSKVLIEFEKSLRSIFSDFESKLPHKASDLHNRKKSIILFREANEKFKETQNNIKNNEERQQRVEEILTLLENAEKAVKKIEKIEAEGVNNSSIAGLYESIIGDYDIVIHDDELKDLYVEKVYPPLKFKKLKKEQESLLNEVVVSLLQTFGYRKANPFIQKLLDKYN